MNLNSDNIKNDIDHPILKNLPKEVRNEIIQRAENEKFSAGSMVCRQGDSGDSFFMIKTGTIRSYRKTQENIEAELAGGAKLNHITRHILGLYQQVPGARKFRRHLSENAYKPGADLQVLGQALEQVRQTAEMQTS